MKEYKYYTFVPTKFMIGIDGNSNGFPSMKNEHGKWTNLSVFEKHCGYKPDKQKDALKEFDKAITQRVQEIENVPTSGFKLVNVHNHIYHTDSFKNVEFAVLQDPRGWNIGIPSFVLQSLLENNGFNIENGELVGVELMYCWPKYDFIPFSVTIANDHAKELQKATANFVGMRETFAALKPSELKVGEVYSAKNGKMASSMFMYMGQHDTYSQRCHERAVRLKKYELEPFIKDRTDATGIKKHVFYRLNGIGNNEHFGHSNDPHNSPYVVLSTANKLFDKHVVDVDFSKFKLYNDKSQFCTYENVKYDMSHSLLFNKVDFSNEAQTFGLVPCNALEDFEGYVRRMVTDKFDSGINYAESKAWPMCKRIDGLHMYSYLYKIPFDLGAYDKYWEIYPSVLNGKWGGRYEEFGKFNADVKSITACKASFKAMYDKLQPKYWLYKFENGQQVPEYQNFCLNVLNYYKDIDGNAY